MEKHCVGIYWFDACRILLPVLERGDMSEVEKYPELLVDYCRETDTLVFGNREAVVRSQEMTGGANRSFRRQRAGWQLHLWKKHRSSCCITSTIP